MSAKSHILAIAVAASLALGVLFAASAAAAEFHSSSSHTVLDGSHDGNDEFSFNAGTVSCTGVKVSGTGSASTFGSLTLTPTWEGCTAFGFLGATVHVNGCGLLINGSGFDIVCPSGKVIEVTSSNCTLTIPAQTQLSKPAIDALNNPPKRFLRLVFAVLGIRYKQHGKGFFPCASTEATNGTFTAEWTVTGTDTSGAQVDFWYA